MEVEEKEMSLNVVRAFPFPYLSKLVDASDDKNMSVKCLLCSSSSNKILKAVWSSSSNLRKHIQRVYPAKLHEMDKLQLDSKKRLGNTSYQTAAKKQTLLTFGAGVANVSQTTVDKLIVSFVCESAQPFSILENGSFVNLIQGLAPNRTVMSRTTLCNRIHEQYCLLKKRLVQQVSKLEAVAVTADCCSHVNRSFMGVTVHWLDPASLHRKSAMLVIKRLTGRHTYDVLAAALDNILRDFGIQNKVTMCVTDSGSNFIKVITMFGVRVGEQCESKDSTSADMNESVDEQDIEFCEMSSVLDEESNDLQYMLPHHQRCAAHTSNLIAVKDGESAENDGSYKKFSRSAFAKCQALWNKQRSTIVCDKLREAYNKTLITPNRTRWNSMFVSVRCLTSLVHIHGSDKLDKVTDAVGLVRLQPAELTFLNEYVVASLNVLGNEACRNISQYSAGRKEHVYWLLAAHHHTCLKKELEMKAKDTMLTYCRPLAKALLDGVNRRFEEVLQDQRLTLAAGLIPSLKFQWISDATEQTNALKILDEEAELACNASATTSTVTLNERSEEQSFFQECSQRL